MPRALLFTAALLVIAPLSADATPFSGCGTLIQGVECLLFQTDQSGTYFLGNYGTFKAGDHVFVTGDAHVCFTACVEGIACITGNTIQICGTHA
ncbi:MAG TPA: hypothetical protein VN972_06490, partial [Methylomirabilota bacterium]|nr:hypothetical protein [Methylomirabilota bacterium]